MNECIPGKAYVQIDAVAFSDQKRALDPPGAGVIGKMLEMDASNKTQILSARLAAGPHH